MICDIMCAFVTVWNICTWSWYEWLTWYDMMYMLYEMTYMADRLHRYSMDGMIDEDEQIWNDLSEYMNVTWWLTWMMRMHVYVVYSWMIKIVAYVMFLFG